MVDIDITAQEVVLRLRGLHKLWAFKREVRVQRAQLKRVEAGVTPEAWSMLCRSIRMPGTSIPSLITAGSYRSMGKWAFWDVTGVGQHAVTISTEGHRYAYLVVDVVDRVASLEALESARRTSNSLDVQHQPSAEDASFPDKF